MTEWQSDRLDLAEHVPDDVADDQRILTDVRLRTDLSTEEGSIVAEYLRGRAAGVDSETPASSQFED